MFLNGNLVFAGAYKRYRWYKAKEAEAGSILCTLKKAKDIDFLKDHILTEVTRIGRSRVLF